MSWDYTYELVYYLETKRHQQNYMPIILYSLNALIHVVIFLSLPSIALVDLSAISNSLPLLVALLGILGLMLFEMFVLLLHKKQFYLLQQLQIFRFVLSPLLLLTTINLTKTQKLLGIQGLLIWILVSLFSGFLSQFLIFQNFRLYSIKHQGVYIVTDWLSFQMLLLSLNVVLRVESQMILSFLLLLISCNTSYKNFRHFNNNSQQNKILYIITLLQVNISCLLLVHQLFSFRSLSPTFALCSLVVMVYLGMRVKLKHTTIVKKMQNVLQLKAKYSDFIELVDQFVYLYRCNKQSVNSKLGDFVVSLVNQHGQQCSMSNCEFLTNNTQEQLKSWSQRSIQQLTHKVQKKIEWIFQTYCQQNSDNYQYTFDFLKFYAYCFHNRVKFQRTLISIDTTNLDWKLRCQYYKFKKICEQIENKENIDVAKTDQVFAQFESNMLSTLTLMHQFWTEFFQEKVDLKRIMKVASKIFPYKSKLEEMAKEQLQLENFTSFKILRLYVLYLRMILNQQLALMLQDHLKITTQRLKDNQNIKYLSMQTQAGFIVICLSESKLGNIFMVNQKACQIFRYKKKDILQKRVNAIMPQIFAVLHDKILTDFLKVRRRKYNTDQRLLFGKDGAGYMFPLQLQLQNTSFTSNDQYIFIAMVKPQKSREIPIYCIVDHEGYVRDYTASFKNIFYYQSRKQKAKNIQQIIPTYFDDDYNQETRISRTLSVPISNKKLGNIEAKFDINPILIKNSHEGFLIKMSYISSNTKFNSRTYRLTQKILQMKREGDFIAFENNYNHHKGFYQISKKAILPEEPNQSIQNTYMKEREMDASFLESMLSEKKNYGTGIKIIRFIKNHFQRIEDDESFQSLSYEDDYQLDIKAKIENVKEKSQNKETKALVTAFAITINIFILLIIIDLAFIYSIYQFEVNKEMDYLAKSDYDKQTRYLLPEYIIYNSLYKANINPDYYYSKITQMKSKIINALINSPFNQTQKEHIYKIIYIKQIYDLHNLIQSDVISVTLEDTQMEKILSVAWGIVIGGCVLLIVAILAIIYKLNGTLFVVYTIFLDLHQQAIRSVHQSCKKMIKLIQFQYNESKMNEAQVQQKQKEDENEIEKMKQFKTLQRSQNKVYFLQMALPLALIVAFVATIIVLNSNSFGLYQTFKTQHYNYFESIPSTSTQFMKTILRTLFNQDINLTNNYSFYLQQIQKNLVDFQSSTNSYDFMSILYGNVCNNSLVVAANQKISCNQLENGILHSGIASSLNYLSEQFKKISLTTKNGPAELLSLLELQYKFVTPIMETMQDKMQDVMISYIQDYGWLFQTLTISLVGLFVLYSLYLYYVPLKDIENEIKFTNGMIALMPEHSISQKSLKSLKQSKKN